MDQENSTSRQTNRKGKEEKRYLMHLETIMLWLPTTRIIRALKTFGGLARQNEADGALLN